jgi:hypothetical protein
MFIVYELKMETTAVFAVHIVYGSWLQLLKWVQVHVVCKYNLLKYAV